MINLRRHNKLKNRKRLRLLIIPLVIIIIFVTIKLIKSNDITGLSGEEWVKTDAVYIDTAISFVENFDNILTLYISGVTTTESFKTDYETLHKQWKLLHTDYANFCDENEVLPKSHTIESQMAKDASDKLFLEVQKLFDELDGLDASNTDYISYVYLAHQQNIIHEYTAYYLCYNIISGTYENMSTINTAN